jgi:hypothetical protein
MKHLTREDILSAQDTVIEDVEVPEWGGVVCVKSLSAYDRDKLEASMLREKGKTRTVSLDDFSAKLFAATVCDEKGKLLFTESDVPSLSKKSAAALRRVLEVAQRLSGMNDADVNKLTGDLKNAPPEGSPTA